MAVWLQVVYHHGMGLITVAGLKLTAFIVVLFIVGFIVDHYDLYGHVIFWPTLVAVCFWIAGLI